MDVLIRIRTLPRHLEVWIFWAAHSDSSSALLRSFVFCWLIRLRTSVKFSSRPVHSALTERMFRSTDCYLFPILLLGRWRHLCECSRRGAKFSEMIAMRDNKLCVFVNLFSSASFKALKQQASPTFALFRLFFISLLLFRCGINKITKCSVVVKSAIYYTQINLFWRHRAIDSLASSFCLITTSHSRWFPSRRMCQWHT